MRAAHHDAGTFSSDAALVAALEEAVSGGVRARASDRLGFAHDASHYFLVPKGVVAPRSAARRPRCCGLGSDRDVSLTFRSGTSLSGQFTPAGRSQDARHSSPQEKRGPT